MSVAHGVSDTQMGLQEKINLHVWIVRSVCHAAQSNNILRQSSNEIHCHLQCSLQCIKVLILNDDGIPQLHSEGITQQTVRLLNVVGRLSSLV